MDAIDPLGESTAKPPPQRVCEIGLQGIVEAIRLIVLPLGPLDGLVEELSARGGP